MNTDEWLTSIGLAEYAPSFRANHVGMDTLSSLTGDNLKELGVASLGHRKRLLDEIEKLSAVAPEESQAAEQATEQPPQEGGMWFNAEGIHFRVPHSQEPDTPFFALSHFISHIAPYQPVIASWISRNYPKDKTQLGQFWKDLAMVLMREGQDSWNLAWRGFIYGKELSVGVLCKSLRRVREGVDQLNWPLDSDVLLVDVNTGQEEKCAWGQLLSPPSG